MLFKPTSFWLTALAAPFFATPLLATAAEATLSLPNEATVGVEVVEELAFESNQARLNDILLHPTPVTDASHSLPEYCVIVGSAQMVDGRIRVTTQEATCIETHDADSDIFTGEFSASAYGEEGQYGIACEGNPVRSLLAKRSFLRWINPLKLKSWKTLLQSLTNSVAKQTEKVSPILCLAKKPCLIDLALLSP